ncbi:MAG TPA: DUF6565 domain-containing protein [Flavobacterium sp.]|nr:DUF6565 domain-containing protein [Flavobacterium sp.]
MKNLNKFLSIMALVVIMSSCKNEKQEMAHMKVDEFKNYVDSVSNVATEETSENWEVIQAKYETTKMEAQEAINQLDDKMDMQATIDKTNSKYDEYKAKVIAEKKTVVVVREDFRNSLFTEKIGNDTSFMWVNKDNIANVYSNLVTTVDNNKKTYTREDWDEIKMLYEALDTRKNTVEKEGLSSEDNTKIAGLKIKFSTMYRVNRMTAKSQENAEAKE